MDKMRTYGGMTGNAGQLRPKGMKLYPLQGRGTLQDLPRSVVKPIPPAFRDDLGKRVKKPVSVRDDISKAIANAQGFGASGYKGRGY